MIYKNSRYTGTSTYSRRGVDTFKRREMITFNPQDAQRHTYIQGDSLDSLAHKYYGDSQLWWVLLDANNKRSPLELSYGEILLVPSYREVYDLWQ